MLRGENVTERGPRAWAAKLESQLVSAMFKKPCKQKPEISVARARAGLELQRDDKKDSDLWEAEEGEQDRRAGPCRLGTKEENWRLGWKLVLRARNTPTQCENRLPEPPGNASC